MAPIEMIPHRSIRPEALMIPPQFVSTRETIPVASVGVGYAEGSRAADEPCAVESARVVNYLAQVVQVGVVARG